MTELTPFLEQYFGEAIQSAAAFYLVASLILAFLQVPRLPEYRPYRLSKNLLALTFLVMGVNLLTWLCLFTGDWHHLNPNVMAVDVSLYYLAGILLSYTYCNLLNRRYITRHRVLKDTCNWSGALLLVILSGRDFAVPYRFWLVTAALLIFAAFVVHFVIDFIRMYKRNIHLIEDYFTEDTRQFVGWISRSLWLTAFSGILALVSMTQGAWFNWFYQLYVVSFNLYILVSFINYSQQYARIAHATAEMRGKLRRPRQLADKKEESLPEQIAEEMESEQEEDEGPDEPANDTLQPLIEKWIAQKKYIGRQFTIEEMALELGTNKSYLSRYINTEYGMNFSTWVGTLRIEEAKLVIMDDPSVKMEELAFRLGFSSLSYFSKTFSKQEGMSPAKWRNLIHK